MPKSRKRRFGITSKSRGLSGQGRHARGASGDPRKRTPVPLAPAASPSPYAPAEFGQRLLLASTLLRKAAAAPLADPLPFAALPPLVLHALRSRGSGAQPAANCADECLTLAHAYAELGIEAQVRVAELTVTDGKSGAQAVHGIPRPYWQDGRFYGHTVVWLPGHRHLIDPAAERYHEIAAWNAGPVIAAAGPGDPAADDGEISLTVTRGYLRLAYTLGPRAATASVLTDPAAHAGRDGDRVRGVNVASEVVWLLASERPAAETAVIPYPRAAALIDAARGMDRHGSAGEDVFFARRGALPGAGPVRLHQIPLPAGTPEPASIG